MMGFRRRIPAIVLLAASVVVVLVGMLLFSRLEAHLMEDRQAQLRRHLLVVRELVELVRPASPGAVDPLVDRLGAAIGARLTVIGADGRVLGDSQVATGALAALGDYSHRPEVLAALRGLAATGVAVGPDAPDAPDARVFYLVERFRDGVLRLALPRAELEVGMDRLRFLLAVAGVSFVLVLLLALLLVSRHFHHTLGELLAGARILAAKVGVTGAEKAVGAGNPPADLPAESRDEMGVVVHSVRQLVEALCEDVTRLTGERNQFGQVLEGMGQGVLLVGADHGIRFANSSARQLLSLSDAFAGRKLSMETRLPPLERLITRSLQEGAALDEFEVGLLPARTVLASANFSTLSAEVVVVLHDTSRLRTLETSRQDFVANLSHEFRTPLSIMRANAETLLEGALEDRQRAREFVTAIVQSTEQLAKLVDSLLDLSRIQAGEYPIQRVRLSPREQAQRAIELLQPGHSMPDLRVENRIPPELSLQCDARALERILFNLIDNAVKYTPEGGRVWIDGRLEAGRCLLEVCDSGPGVPEVLRERVFERFFQVTSGRSPGRGGVGLGLAIVKHLVKLLGGNLGVDSAAGGGARFFVILPEAEAGALGSPLASG